MSVGIVVAGSIILVDRAQEVFDFSTDVLGIWAGNLRCAELSLGYPGVLLLLEGMEHSFELFRIIDLGIDLGADCVGSYSQGVDG